MHWLSLKIKTQLTAFCHICYLGNISNPPLVHCKEIIFSLHRSAASQQMHLQYFCNWRFITRLHGGLFIVNQQQIFVIFCFFFRCGRILKGIFSRNPLFFGFLLGLWSWVILNPDFERSRILMLISFLKITSLTASSTISSKRSLSFLKENSFIKEECLR